MATPRSLGKNKISERGKQSVPTTVCSVVDIGSHANLATASKMVPKMLAAARFEEATTQLFIQTSASSFVFG